MNAGDAREASGARAVGAGEELEEVAVGVLEVDAPPAVLVVDLAQAAAHRIGPVVEVEVLDAAEALVELLLGHEEGVVLAGEVAGRVCVVEVHAVAEVDLPEVAVAAG